MKKLLNLSIILVLLMSLITSAFAADVDLASLSDDEVVELTKACQDELAARGLNKAANLPEGYYIAGQDIPVGSYYAILTLPDEATRFSERESIYIYTSFDSSADRKFDCQISGDAASHTKEVYFSIQEGEVLLVDGIGSVKLTIATGGVQFK